MNTNKFWLFGGVLVLTGALMTGLVRGDEAIDAGKALADRTKQAQADSISTVSESNYLGHKDQDVSELTQKQSSGNMEDEAVIKAANDPSAALVVENFSNRDAYKMDPKTDPMFQRKAEAGRDAMLVADRYEDCVELEKDGTGYGEERSCESAGTVYAEDYTCTEATTGSCGEDLITRYFAVYDADPHCPYDADNPWHLEGDECVRGYQEKLPALQERVYKCPVDENNPWTLVGTQCTRTIKDETEAYGDPIYSCPNDGKEWDFNENDNKCRHYWTEIIPANGTPVFGCLDSSYTYDPTRKVCWKDTTETRPYWTETTRTCDPGWALEGAICTRTIRQEIASQVQPIQGCNSPWVKSGSQCEKITRDFQEPVWSSMACDDYSKLGYVFSGIENKEYGPACKWKKSGITSWRPYKEWYFNAKACTGDMYCRTPIIPAFCGSFFEIWGSQSKIENDYMLDAANETCYKDIKETKPLETIGYSYSCESGWTKDNSKNPPICWKNVQESKPANEVIEQYCQLGWTDTGTGCTRGSRDEHPADQVDTAYACNAGYTLQNSNECHRPRVDIVDATLTGTNYFCDAGWLLQHPNMCYRFRDESQQAELDYIIYSCGPGWTLEEPDCVRGYEDRIAALGFDGESYPIEILSSFPPGPGASSTVIQSYFDPATVPVDIHNLGGGQLQQPPLFAIDDGLDLGFIYAHVQLTRPPSMPVWGVQGLVYLTVDLRQGQVINYTFEQTTAGNTPTISVQFGISTRVGELKAGEVVPWESGAVPTEVCTSVLLDGDLLGIEVQAGANAFRVSAGIADSSIVSVPTCANGLQLTIKVPYTFTGIDVQSIHSGFGLWAGKVLECDYSEETNEICPSNKRWNAEHIDSTCAREGWQLINGFPIHRGCWSWEHDWRYEEIVMEESQACADLRAQGCGVLTSACTQVDSQGRCVRTQQTYSCGTDGSQQVAEICQSLFPCVDGECNQEYDTSKDATGDLAKAATSMEMMNQMMADLDPDNIEFFSGEDAKCQVSSLGLKNCCKDSGWGVDIGITDCDAEEVALGYAKQEGRSIYVGKYTSGTWPDERDYRVYCSYSSKLAKLLVEQGNAQLGKGYGKPKEPICDGFTQDEFGELDLNAMDFSDYFQNALEKLDNQSPTVNQAVEDFSESIQARTED